MSPSTTVRARLEIEDELYRQPVPVGDDEGVQNPAVTVDSTVPSSFDAGEPIGARGLISSSPPPSAAIVRAALDRGIFRGSAGVRIAADRAAALRMLIAEGGHPTTYPIFMFADVSQEELGAWADLPKAEQLQRFFELAKAHPLAYVRWRLLPAPAGDAGGDAQVVRSWREGLERWAEAPTQSSFLMHPEGSKLAEATAALPTSHRGLEEALAVRHERPELWQVDWVDLSEQQVRVFDSVFLHRNDTAAGWYFLQLGWVRPAFRGVIEVADWFSQGLASNTTVKRRRALLREGHRITFNQAPEIVVRSCMRMRHRRSSAASPGSTWMGEQHVLSFLENLRLGRGLSVEVWSPQGEVIAGLWGMASAHHIGGASVFYPSELRAGAEPPYKSTDILGKPDFFKVGVLSLLEALKEAGLPLLDIGAVSPVMRTMKGKYIPDAVFRSHATEGAAERLMHVIAQRGES